MKLQIKTLNRKSLVIEIDETKTVYELKQELSLYADIGVKPEFQKLIYAGKILDNNQKLSFYNIDVKKYLVIMTLKQPLFGQEEEKTTKEQDKANSPSPPPRKETDSDREFRTPTPPVSEQRKENIVRQILGMGYPEPEVRKALIASYYNAERAIEYLVEGIPGERATEDLALEDTDADLSMTAFEVFRGDPIFRGIRNILQQHPELIDSAIRRIAITNPAMLNLINDNQHEFLSLLIEGAADDDDDDDDEEMDEDD